MTERYYLILSYVSTLLIGFIDYQIGSELSFSLFYLISVYLAVRHGDKFHGIMVAFLSSFVWYHADNLAGRVYSNEWIAFWNAGIRLGIFLMFGLLLASLREANKKEADSARHDFLTGLHNSRSFYEYVEFELTRSKRYGHSFLLAYIDLDNFKTVNDSSGHVVGDNLLKTVSATMKENTRENDMVARLGGDEFAILVPELPLTGAETIINKMHEQLLNKMNENSWPVTFSIGAVYFNDVPEDVQNAVSIADNLMYAVKKKGKNAIEILNYPNDTG